MSVLSRVRPVFEYSNHVIYGAAGIVSLHAGDYAGGISYLVLAILSDGRGNLFNTRLAVFGSDYVCQFARFADSIGAIC